MAATTTNMTPRINAPRSQTELDAVVENMSWSDCAARARRAGALAMLSDEELAARGLARRDLVRRAFTTDQR